MPGSPVAHALDHLGCADAPLLSVGGVPAAELADRFGTPLFAYDAGVVRRRYEEVRGALGPRVAVVYALKANPCGAVARVLARAGAGCEIASRGEGAVAAAAGFGPERTGFAGPGKSDEELAWAIAAGLTVHAEAGDEVDRLAALAAAEGRRVRVAVRVDLDAPVQSARLRMAGGAAWFGVAEEEVPEVLRRIAGDDHLELHGVHQYAGTQCLDARAWLAGAGALLERAAAWEEGLGVELPHRTLGGGFGVPWSGEEPLDLDVLGRDLAGLLAAVPGERRHAVELGRWLTAPAGVYLTRIVSRKRRGGRPIAVLDGGLHHVAAATGFGTVLRRPFPVVAAEHLGEPAGDGTLLAGPLCTPQDSLGVHELPADLGVGDLVAVLMQGAYGLTFSPVRFLGHPLPAEVLVDGGVPELARVRGRPEDLLAGQPLP